jgi:aspartate carbamoyltransferase catalytic subunit
MFFEPSTRTRASFELAGASLGAHVMNFDLDRSSLAKAETFADTLETIGAMSPAAIVIRHASSGAARRAARCAKVPVINAGAGVSSHPTQALLDVLTISRYVLPSVRQDDPRRGTGDDAFAGIRVMIVGDIARSRVAKSLMRLLPTLGMELVLVGPEPFLPDRFALLGHRVERSLDAALAERPHVVYALRVQRERILGGVSDRDLDAYARGYRIGRERLSQGAPEAFVMHPGPVNRGVELESGVLEMPRCLVLKQVAAGVDLRRAILLRQICPDLFADLALACVS